MKIYKMVTLLRLYGFNRANIISMLNTQDDMFAN